MILGVDQSLTMTGWVLGDSEQIVRWGFIETKPESRKLLHVSAHDAERCRTISRGLCDPFADCRAVFFELPGGSQSARAAKAMGLAMGCVVGAAEVLNLPIGWVTASDAKKALTDDPIAGKDVVLKAAKGSISGLDRLARLKAEAVADAYAVFRAALHTSLGVMALQPHPVQGVRLASSVTRSR